MGSQVKHHERTKERPFLKFYPAALAASSRAYVEVQFLNYIIITPFKGSRAHLFNMIPVKYSKKSFMTARTSRHYPQIVLCEETLDERA